MTVATDSPTKTKKRPMWPVIGIVLLIVVAAAVAGGYYLRTYHLATVDPGKLYRSGNVATMAFTNGVARVKPKTIVCLFDDREIAGDRRDAFENEQAVCKARGIDLVRIAVPLGGWPSGEQVKQFLSVAEDPARQPVLVHCAQGVRRTGFMVAAYQESVLKFTPDATKYAMLTFGHSLRTVGDIQRFIDVYDPATQTMTKELAPSDE